MLQHSTIIEVSQQISEVAATLQHAGFGIKRLNKIDILDMAEKLANAARNLEDDMDVYLKTHPSIKL